MEEKRSEKRKRLLFIAVMVISIITAAGSGFLLGMKGRESVGGSQALQAGENKAVYSRRIAVVNQDKGTEVDGKIVNYASQLITDLDSNFAMTSLEEARQGLENGLYGAYITIPASFSESVVSLNRRPRKAEVEFFFNENLGAEVMDNVILDTVAFVQKLNHDLSYMYVNTILKEFHTAQDAAQKVMENDQNDEEVILQIKPLDLVTMFTMPKMEWPENTTKVLDVQEYINKNLRLADTIGEQYREYISISEADYEALSSRGNELFEQWGTMESVIESIQLTQDEEGKVVYEEGMNTVSTTLNTYNESLEAYETNTLDALTEVQDHLTGVMTGQEAWTQNYNVELEQIKQGMEGMKHNYIYPEFTLNNQQLYFWGEAVSTLDGIGVDQSLLNQVQEKWSARMKLLNDYGQHIEAGGTNSGFAPADTDLIAAGYADVSDLLTDMQNGSVTDGFSGELFALNNPVDLQAVQTQLSQIVQNYGVLTNDEFNQTIDGLQAGLKPYENKISVSREDGTQEEQEVTALLTGMLDKLSLITTTRIEKLDVDNVTNQMEDGVVQPLVVRTKEVKEDLKTQYQNEKQEYEEYGSLLKEYDPLKYIDQAEINETKARMNENGYELSSEILEYDSSQTEYVGNVQKDAVEKVTSLQTYIEEAQKASEDTVEKGLIRAQEIKAANGEENQRLMFDFTRKLPYTRLGSLEYAQANEFMVSPLKMIQRVQDYTPPVSAGGQIPQKAATEGLEDLKMVLSIIGAVSVLLVSGTFARRFRAEKE